MIDHGMLNVPLAKRGCIDAQIDAYKAQTAHDGGRSSRHYADERALVLDYSQAANMSTPDLLALAMGLASSPRARIAAMDELRARYLRAQNLPGELA